MSEPKPHNLAEIEGLLASRHRLMSWLDRLEEAGSRAPRQVRAKVQADYRARLAQVVSQLSTHGELIASTLEGLRTDARDFRQLRTEEDEVRAEAELRHAVGEYTDDEWQLVELESSGKIGGYDEELERLTSEIHRLEEVQGLITPESIRQPEAVESFPPEPETIPEHLEIQNPPDLEMPPLTLVRESEPIPPAARPEAPRFVPRGGTPKPRESGPSRAIPFPPPQQQAASASAVATPKDELAFLRSVTLESPAQRSPTTPSTPAERDDRPVQPLAKTLKCAECGSLNRPTEWYCERCGAELAAL
ncbi:MAG TPA: hypothetical protein VGQ69_16250 [Gemmatimonadales bacterium]|jgi:hypothetical protein|nr:hypothetical protein [Gemmatimonadales bacterium]